VGVARAGDGDLIWRTLDLPHFEVHYPQRLERVAFRVARMCEEAYDVLTPLFDHKVDRKVQVRLTDFGDFANGSATALPYPRIILFAAPPSLDGNLNDYDDWMRLLIFHEYVHILQLDNRSGLPAWLNFLFGGTFAPNQNLPSFMLEGEAVWGEALTSGRGRIRSAVFRGTLRAQALAGVLPTIDQMVHAPLHFPGANVWYMHGGHFADWVARTRGMQTAGQVHDAMSDQLIPFSLNRSMFEATGQIVVDLFRSWRADLTAQSQAEAAAIEAAGRTPSVALTTTGQTHDNPRFLHDGRLMTYVSAPQQITSLYTVEGPDRLVRQVDVDGLSRFDACHATGRLLYDLPQPHTGAYTFFDLFALELATGKRYRITRGQRLREPACSPDGTRAVASQIRSGRTVLVEVDLGTGVIEVLHDPGDLNQVGYPVYTPDGQGVVFERVSQRHGRDLVWVDRRTGDITALTDDAALELHPRFSRDGRWLIYASDVDGVFNLYARAWNGGRPGEVQRVTRVVTGAIDPDFSPDGTQVVFRMLTAEGTDLHRVDFKPGAPPPPSPEPDVLRPDPGEAPFESRAYAPLETLFPVAWSPSFTFSNIESAVTQLGIDVVTSDAAGLHTVIAGVQTVPEEDALGVSASWFYNNARANVSLSASHNTATQANGALHGSVPQPFRRDVTTVSTGVSLPLSRAGRGSAFAIRYGYTLLQGAENLDPVHDPLDLAPRTPDDSDRGALSAALRFGDIDGTPFSISAEAGRAFGMTVRVRHPQLGGQLETAELFFDYTEYIDLWWRHALALRLVTAFGRGATDDRVFYALGAPQQRNVVLDALDEIGFGSTFLRGYPAGTVRGDRYALMTAEYRLPIADVFRGPDTVPAFFRRMKFSLFTDWGQAATEPLEAAPSAFKKSVGMELVTEATLAWRLSMSVRLGYAWGLNAGSEDQLYFFVGQWF
jgi:Tol biopolymer transport system component